MAGKNPEDLFFEEARPDDDISESVEYTLAERFERGERDAPNDRERQILHAYQRQIDRLNSIDLPKWDAFALSQKLQREMEQKSPTFRKWREPFEVGRFLQTGKLAASFTILLFSLCVYLGVGFMRNPVHDLLVKQESERVYHSASWWWKQKFADGRFVRIPAGVQMELKLQDDSTLSCSANTMLSVQYGDHRTIALYRGKISIHAMKDLKHPMSVNTPLGTVRVTGTKFTLEIIP